MNFSPSVVGDGMGFASTTSGRILKGQMRNKSGEETRLAMDNFHFTGFAKVKFVLFSTRN